MLPKDRIKSTIDFDKKLMFWIHKNYKSIKTKKNYYNSNTNKINSIKNKNKLIRHESLLNINGSNFYNNNNNNLKNKNFPCINSINVNHSPIKKMFELNDINTNSRQIKSNRSNFNTINSTITLNKVQSAKNIHNKNKMSKIHKMLNQNPTFTPFSYQRNKINSKPKKGSLIKKRFDSTKRMPKKKNNKNLFGNGYNGYNGYNLNFNPRNLKVESGNKIIDSKNDMKNIKNM